MDIDKVSPIFKQRRAGILLHPTSLPGPYVGGDMGHTAYRFIEFLKSTGCTVWQMLPLGPTHEDRSPYQCLSVHAGNPLLISLDWLIDRYLLDLKEIDCEPDSPKFRLKCLKHACKKFFEEASDEWLEKYKVFRVEQADWLDDYALFMAIKRSQNGKAWIEWPEDLRHREHSALKQAEEEFSEFIQQIEFEQFIFFTQWHEIKDYAHQHDVMLFGDMPIFVSHDSADVWAQRKNFLIDEDGIASVVAGVPPDAFSEEGQRWGNPLYDWKHMQKDNFEWWKQRFRTQLELFDLIRIDHFRGFEACWEIPAEEETAINGEWVQVPGRELLESLYAEFNNLSLVAEDLGVITDDVNQLRKDFNLPGMKILQFAWGGDSHNPYLPHNHEEICVVYTGTHDNDTTLGWYHSLDENTKLHINDYVGVRKTDNLDMPWMLNKMALSSVARLVILPLQDILKLGSEHRMNIPGTTENNWLWRFELESLNSEIVEKLKYLLSLYGRL